MSVRFGVRLLGPFYVSFGGNGRRRRRVKLHPLTWLVAIVGMLIWASTQVTPIFWATFGLMLLVQVLATTRPQIQQRR